MDHYLYFFFREVIKVAIDQYASLITANSYGYQASLKFVFTDGEIYNLSSEYVMSIVIDSDYIGNNMPMVFVTIHTEDGLIDKIVQEQDTAVAIFDLKKKIVNNNMEGYFTDYISGKFIYIVSEDLNKDLGLDDDDVENDYDTFTIGLLNLDHVNKNKRDVNCVVNGKMSSVLYYLTSNHPILIEPIKNNINLQNQFIPPMNSLAKVLSYLNNISVFYPTKYRFFIDFDCSYLISSSGKAVQKQGESVTTVMVKLKNSIKEGTKEGGMWLDAKESMYVVEVDGADVELYDNHVAHRSYTKINATDTSGTKSNTTLNYSDSLGSVKAKSRNIRIYNNNSGMLSNISSGLESGKTQIMIQKTDTDSSIFTINKEYMIRAEEIYGTDKYDGRYILVRKRELYIKNGDSMRMNVMLLLEKAPV